MFCVQLPETQHISKIKLVDKTTGDEVGVIENKPGSAGSVRVYSYLLDIFGVFISLQYKATPKWFDDWSNVQGRK
jgi:hypothetical protein